MALKAIFIVVHLIGVFIGVWGAIITDVSFMRSLKKKFLGAEDLKDITEGSSVVWVGILVILLSGIALFSFDPAGYLAYPKFRAKMTVVAILLLNGIVFHFKHLTELRGAVNKEFPSENFAKKSASLFVSGAVSTTSWIAAIILGFLPALPLSYSTIMLIYFSLLALAAVAALFMRKMLWIKRLS